MIETSYKKYKDYPLNAKHLMKKKCLTGKKTKFEMLYE